MQIDGEHSRQDIYNCLNAEKVVHDFTEMYNEVKNVIESKGVI